VHARQTRPPVLDLRTGELVAISFGWRRWRWCRSSSGWGRKWVAVYETGPTGFELARAARARGIEVRVRGAGVDPEGSGGIRSRPMPRRYPLVRLLAAGELSFAVVATYEDERFRGALHRGHPVCPAPAREGPIAPRGALRTGGGVDRYGHAVAGLVQLRGACSEVTFVDYLATVELLQGRRQTLLDGGRV
jgi:hypothetical protein